MKTKVLIARILKAVAVGMGAAVLVLRILNVINVDTSIVMLSMGLFALAVASLPDAG